MCNVCNFVMGQWPSNPKVFEFCKDAVAYGWPKPNPPHHCQLFKTHRLAFVWKGQMGFTTKSTSFCWKKLVEKFLNFQISSLHLGLGFCRADLGTFLEIGFKKMGLWIWFCSDVLGSSRGQACDSVGPKRPTKSALQNFCYKITFTTPLGYFKGVSAVTTESESQICPPPILYRISSHYKITN